MPMPNTSSGFTNLTPRASRPDPRSEVQSFINQDLGRLNAGLSAAPGATSPAAIRQGSRVQAPVQLSAQKQIADVRAGGQRLTQGVQLVQKVRQQREAARQRLGQPQYGGSPQGRAYTPDGRLSASRNRALQLASSYLGTRYQLGGTTYKGIDCSGLVMMVYGQLGYKLSHSASAQGRNIPGVRTSLSNLRPGDLVAWKDGSHIAIYAGNGMIIEAANPRVGTVRRKLWAPASAVYGIALRLPGE